MQKHKKVTLRGRGVPRSGAGYFALGGKVTKTPSGGYPLTPPPS